MRAVPRLCELYPDICLTTEEKARENRQSSKTSVRVVNLLTNSFNAVNMNKAACNEIPALSSHIRVTHRIAYLSKLGDLGKNENFPLTL